MLAIKRLQQFLDSGRLPHALLLIGWSIEQEALLFAQKVVGAEQHPDLHIYKPEGKIGMHTLPAMKQLIHEVALRPFQAPYKVCLLYEAERMLPTSSNALLKTLEEPPPRTLLILVSAHQERLLPTIVSRCQTVRFAGQPVRKAPLFPQGVTLEKLLEQGEQIEEKRKQLSDHLLRSLSTEHSLAQREILAKEVEAATAIHYLEDVEELMRTLLEECWSQRKMERGFSFFAYETALKECLLGVQRSMKLSHCLEALHLKTLSLFRE